MTTTLTPRQAGLKNFIQHYVASLGYPPSYPDMMAGCKIKSKSQVHRLLRELEKRGHVRITPRAWRAIEVSKPAGPMPRPDYPAACPCCGWNLLGPKPFKGPQ